MPMSAGELILLCFYHRFSSCLLQLKKLHWRYNTPFYGGKMKQRLCLWTQQFISHNVEVGDAYVPCLYALSHRGGLTVDMIEKSSLWSSWFLTLYCIYYMTQLCWLYLKNYRDSDYCIHPSTLNFRFTLSTTKNKKYIQLFLSMDSEF
jgi:hypothetical protein